MREILFKAKRIDNGEWVEGYYSKSPDPMLAFLKDFIFAPYFDEKTECGYDNGYKIDINTLCQYTGLTDKNGNKIWENDVVWIDGTDRAIVIFSEKHSGYILQPIGDFYFDSPMLVDNVDIIDNCIGNIFDNPELLGV